MEPNPATPETAPSPPASSRKIGANRRRATRDFERMMRLHGRELEQRIFDALRDDLLRGAPRSGLRTILCVKWQLDDILSDYRRQGQAR